MCAAHHSCKAPFSVKERLQSSLYCEPTSYGGTPSPRVSLARIHVRAGRIDPRDIPGVSYYTGSGPPGNAISDAKITHLRSLVAATWPPLPAALTCVPTTSSAWSDSIRLISLDSDQSKWMNCVRVINVTPECGEVSMLLQHAHRKANRGSHWEGWEEGAFPR